MADLANIAEKAQKYAKAHPWTPIFVPISNYSRFFEYMGFHFQVNLTFTVIGETSAWQCSLCTEEHGNMVPEALVETIAKAFMPVPYVQFKLPRSVQFVEDNSVGRMLEKMWSRT